MGNRLSLWQRLLLAVVLLAGLYGLGRYYAVVERRQTDLPHIAWLYERGRWQGERAKTFGWVTAACAEGFRMREYSGLNATIVCREHPPAQTLVLARGQLIGPTTLLVTERDLDLDQFWVWKKYCSALAALLLILIMFRRYRIDWRRGYLVERRADA